MAVQPPFGLIPSLAQQPQVDPLNTLVQEVGKVGQSIFQAKQLEAQRGQEAVLTLLKTFDLKPTPVGQPAQGATVADMLRALNRGTIPTGLPSDLLAMQAVPKSDLANLARMLPSIISGQDPNKPTPLEGAGGILKPGTVPGLQEGAEVTGRKPVAGQDRGKEVDRIFGQASSAARALISQRIQQATVDPRSANVKNFPILDPKISKQELLKEMRREAEIRGATEPEIKERLGKVQKDLDAEEAGFNAELGKAKLILQRKLRPPEEIKQYLLRQFPLFQGTILNDPELR